MTEHECRSSLILSGSWASELDLQASEEALHIRLSSCIFQQFLSDIFLAGEPDLAAAQVRVKTCARLLQELCRRQLNLP